MRHSYKSTGSCSKRPLLPPPSCKHDTLHTTSSHPRQPGSCALPAYPVPVSVLVPVLVCLCLPCPLCMWTPEDWCIAIAIATPTPTANGDRDCHCDTSPLRRPTDRPTDRPAHPCPLTLAFALSRARTRCRSHKERLFLHWLRVHWRAGPGLGSRPRRIRATALLLWSRASTCPDFSFQLAARPSGSLRSDRRQYCGCAQRPSCTQYGHTRQRHLRLLLQDQG